MSSLDHRFLFASLDSKKPLTARKVHIRRLYDVMQLSIHRNDLSRASRAWCILARCKEVHWVSMWATGFHLISTELNEGDRNPKRLEYLRAMMLRHQDDRESILKELVFRLTMIGQHKEALDELELYLPSFPYQDNPVLHIYAGLITLYLAQPSADTSSFNSILLRDAQTHFERAKALDPDNFVAQGFIEKITSLSGTRGGDLDSDNDSMEFDDTGPNQKRVRAST